MKKSNWENKGLGQSANQQTRSSFLSSRNFGLKPNTQSYSIKRPSPVRLSDISSPIIQSLPSRLTPPIIFNYKISKADQINPPAIQKTTLGKICSFGCNSLTGNIRQKNQDRISIVTNIPQPDHFTGFNWPQCSFFAVYDGHGGSICSQFMKQHLYQYIINNEHFPHNPKEALITGFAEAQKEFLEFAVSVSNFSGSCAVVVLIVADRCYVANLGDSRAILSYRDGCKTLNLTVDHKPNSERKRIEAAGGLVYHSPKGVYRLFPGKLAVSRSFGDIESKISSLGGVFGALSAVPQVWSFVLNQQADFIVMASDGVFDVMKNESVVNLVWDAVKKQKVSFGNCGEIANLILETALERNSQDNVSCIVINLKNRD